MVRVPLLIALVILLTLSIGERTGSAQTTCANGSSVPIIAVAASRATNNQYRACDGNNDTYWRTDDSPNQAWIRFDLGPTPVSLGKIRWRLKISGRADRYFIETSSNGTQWNRLGRFGNGTANVWREIPVNFSARYVRFLFKNINDDPFIGGLAEVEFAPSAPPQLCQNVTVKPWFGLEQPDHQTAEANWDRAVAGSPPVDIMVANVNDGPGDPTTNNPGPQDDDIEKVNQLYRPKVEQTQNAGVTVVGYVETQRGEPLALRSMAALKGEIDLWYQWFPSIDGIYFDVMSTTDDDSAVSFYQELAQYVRAKDADALIMGNPGYYRFGPESDPARYLDDYLGFIDIIETYEDTYDEYLEIDSSAFSIYQGYPAGRFYHVVYGVPQNDLAITNALTKAKERNAGHVFISDVTDTDLVYKTLDDPASSFDVFGKLLAGACP